MLLLYYTFRLEQLVINKELLISVAVKVMLHSLIHFVFYTHTHIILYFLHFLLNINVAYFFLFQHFSIYCLECQNYMLQY